MLYSLRRKFIIIAMASVIGVLFALMAVINVLNYGQVMEELEQRLDMIEEFDGDLKADMGGPGAGFRGEAAGGDAPGPAKDGKEPFKDGFDHRRFKGLNADSPFDTRYFVAEYQEDDNTFELNMDNVASISEDEARKLAADVYENGKTQGMKSGFLYRRCEKDSGEIYYIFLLTRREMSTFRDFLISSILVSTLGVILVYVAVFFLSGRIMKPVAESYEKQKRFITDASHELKTPLAIIEANTEVIEMTVEESEWTRSIRHQISRLSSLIEKLVFLSRMDEESTKLNITRINLSELIEDVCEGFEAVSVSSDKPLALSIEPEMYYEGDEAMLRQMVSLLMDNALKYATSGSSIEIILESRYHGRHRVRLTQKNAADNITAGNKNELFERFYRSDPSRSSETGGSGIGLSVVQAIVSAHHGRISAESPDGESMEFKILL